MATKKKIYIIIIILAALVITTICFIVYTRTRSGSVLNGSLSDRAQEYLAAHSQEDQAWKTVRLEDEKKVDPKAPSRNAIKVGNCFSVIIPIAVLNIKNKETCFMVFATESPKGNIRTYEHATQYADINEVSDIKMRRVFKDKYSERSIPIKGSSVLSFEDKDPLMYDAVTFYLHNRRLIIISMQYPTTENLDTIMDKVVTSLKVL